MKKLTTAFAALAAGVVAMAAPVTNTGLATGVKVTGVNPAYQQEFQMMQKGIVVGENKVETRSYVDASGKEYEIRLQLTSTPLCEVLTFQDAEGQPYQPLFDNMPFYLGVYTLTRTDVSGNVPTIITFNMAWPSMYIYDQVWHYDGPIADDGSIPVDLREYSPVTLDMLANTTDRCGTFQEAEFVGPGDVVNNMWSYWSMLPNALLGDPCLYDDQLGYTELTTQRASSLEFTMYDPQEDWLEINNRIYVALESGTTKRLQVSYKGTADIEGSTNGAVTKEVPEFGDVHLFNTGIQSSDAWGDNNPYPGDFEPLTAFYFISGDKYLGWSIDPTATVFDVTKISNTGLNLPAGEKVRDHANYVMGYLYETPNFANDPELNPENLDFTMLSAEMKYQDATTWYGYLVPEAGACIPYGIGDMQGNLEPWAKTYGLHVMRRNLNEMYYTPTNLGWGYKEGLIINLINEYNTTFQCKSTGKLYYHYNPNDMKAYRELSLTGGKEYNSVEGVEVVEEGTPVYFNLNGVRVDGNNLAKGVYVKVCGNKAQKILVK